MRADGLRQVLWATVEVDGRGLTVDAGQDRLLARELRRNDLSHRDGEAKHERYERIAPNRFFPTGSHDPAKFQRRESFAECVKLHRDLRNRSAAEQAGSL